MQEKQPIEERLNIVELFLNNPELSEKISGQIQLIGDLERLISKVATGRISPREVAHLKRGLHCIEQIKLLCENAPSQEKDSGLKKIGEQLNACLLIRERIEKEVVPDPPPMLNKGKVISDGVNTELDELRQIMSSGKNYLLEIQQRESERTGIGSLKVSFNNIFGYYLEVTNTHKNKVPSDWIRKQTLSNCERYITEELKQYEEKILGAGSKRALSKEFEGI